MAYSFLKTAARGSPFMMIGFMWAKLDWSVWPSFIVLVVLVALSVWGSEREG